MDGPLFFGSVNQFQYKINSIPAKTDVVVIRMKKVPFIDQSGLYALESAILDMTEKKITVLLSMPQPQPAYMMRNNFMIPDLVSEDHVFSTFQGCAERLKDFCQG